MLYSDSPFYSHGGGLERAGQAPRHRWCGRGWFGYSIAVAGDATVIGAPFDDDHGINSGSAYVFVLERDGDGDGVPDLEDACPLENATGFDADHDGRIDSLSRLTEVVTPGPGRDDRCADGKQPRLEGGECRKVGGEGSDLYRGE